jgi:hypothetical protein
VIFRRIPLDYVPTDTILMKLVLSGCINTLGKRHVHMPDYRCSHLCDGMDAIRLTNHRDSNYILITELTQNGRHHLVSQ